MQQSLATAYSLDGRTFEYETGLATPLAVGQHVRIETGTMGTRNYLGLVQWQQTSTSGSRTRPIMTLGQTEGTQSVPIKVIRGGGVLLRKIEGNRLLVTTASDTFAEAQTFSATSERVAQYLESVVADRPALSIGTAWRETPCVPVRVPTDRFMRRTFLCGQSGSGKTFALGVILEGLLLNTSLSMVILDINSDFIRLDAIRSKADVDATRSAAMSPQAYDALAAKHATVCPDIHIFRPGGYAADPVRKLGIRFSDLDVDAQAILLRLDPIADESEYQTFLSVRRDLSTIGPYTLGVFQERYDDDRARTRDGLSYRFDNLRLSDWDIWNNDYMPNLIEWLSANCRCLVVDLGPLDPEPRYTVALAVLTHLWQHRYDRKPVLLTIDEAQHLSSPDPLPGLQAETTQYINLIAAEGRKYGIYLLLATQRPRKIHPNALSECDNAILMRLNSRADLAFIADNFSQAPQGLLDRCPFLGQGEALFVGSGPDQISLAKFEGRLTEEGRPSR